MNILMRFEDEYGCYELFKRSDNIISRIYNNTGTNNSCNITMTKGLTSPGVLDIKDYANKSDYDYIIVVFDLDGIGKELITGEDLRKYMDNVECIHNKRSNYVILVPVFCCFEVLYLYSGLLRPIIEKCDKSINKSYEILSILKTCKDYSDYIPESSYNLVGDLARIENNLNNILGSTKKLTIQRFFSTYSKFILKLAFPSVAAKDKYDKIFIKRESKLYDTIDSIEGEISSKELIDSIINGMGLYSVYNDMYFYKLLTARNFQDINNMITDKQKLDEMCKNIDEYNSSAYGINKSLYDELTISYIQALYLRAHLKIQ